MGNRRKLIISVSVVSNMEDTAEVNASSLLTSTSPPTLISLPSFTPTLYIAVPRRIRHIFRNLSRSHLATIGINQFATFFCLFICSHLLHRKLLRICKTVKYTAVKRWLVVESAILLQKQLIYSYFSVFLEDLQKFADEGIQERKSDASWLKWKENNVWRLHLLCVAVPHFGMR